MSNCFKTLLGGTSTKCWYAYNEEINSKEVILSRDYFVMTGLTYSQLNNRVNAAPPVAMRFQSTLYTCLFYKSLSVKGER